MEGEIREGESNLYDTVLHAWIEQDVAGILSVKQGEVSSGDKCIPCRWAWTAEEGQLCSRSAEA